MTTGSFRGRFLNGTVSSDKPHLSIWQQRLRLRFLNIEPANRIVVDSHNHSNTAYQYLPNWCYKGPSSFADRVLKWSDGNYSDFPWRRRRTPYEVLVAELLLKRTTATAAARVYECFLRRFPTPLHVTSTPDEVLVEALSTVGLQRQRARSIKHLARWLLLKHDGAIPSDYESLLEVPGLGEYSATAIMSFGFGVPAAVLDSNVERILLRVFSTTLPSHPTRVMLREIAQILLPKERHRAYNYGILDLGRLICRYSSPKCGECPIASDCGFANSRKEGSRKITADDANTLTRPLRKIRKERGISLQDLANAAGVSKLTIIRIESGRTNPRSETLDKLAKVLSVHPKMLTC